MENVSTKEVVEAVIRLLNPTLDEEVVEAVTRLLNPVLNDPQARSALERAWLDLTQDARDKLSACVSHFAQAALDTDHLQTEASEVSEPTPMNNWGRKQIVIEVQEDFVPEDGDAFDAVLAALDFADIPASVVERPAPFAAISLDGGLVRAVHSNVPLGYVVLDSDVEGAENREIAYRPDPLNGGIGEFYATAHTMADRNPEVIEALQQALAQEDASA
jgi:hypothetical protein